MCFQPVKGLPCPFEGQIVEDYGTRFVLKAGNREESVNRGACSSYPYKTPTIDKRKRHAV